MEDLADIPDLSRGQAMLGGGNPAHIPEVEAAVTKAVMDLAKDPSGLARAIGDYDPPRGNIRFIEVLSELLRRRYGWPIGPDNIALTNGSQSAFFALMNLLAGRMDDGTSRKVLLPLAPEYMGYMDAAVDPGVFVTIPAKIELIGDHSFKYHPDLDAIRIGPDIGAICVSRPSNPSGNVLSDSELERIWQLAAGHHVPLILDCAYGPPFPDIVYTQVSAFWRPGTILCLSLSKLGLPGVRTGIVIADPVVIHAVASINAATGLAPGGVGPAIMTRLIEEGRLETLCQEVIRPFYSRRAQMAVQILTDRLGGLPFRIHRPDGGFFIWLWLEGLPVGCLDLYERLKAAGVVVVPGRHFFIGSARDWPHADQCIRISYTTDQAHLEFGLDRLCTVIRQLYQAG